MMPRSMYNKTAIISPLNIVLSQVRIQTKTSNGQNTTEGQKEDRDGVEDMLLIGGGEKPHVLKDDISFMAPNQLHANARAVNSLDIWSLLRDPFVIHDCASATEPVLWEH